MTIYVTHQPKNTYSINSAKNIGGEKRGGQVSLHSQKSCSWSKLTGVNHSERKPWHDWTIYTQSARLKCYSCYCPASRCQSAMIWISYRGNAISAKLLSISWTTQGISNGIRFWHFPELNWEFTIGNVSFAVCSITRRKWTINAQNTVLIYFHF